MATQTQVLGAPIVARKSAGLWRDAFGRLAKNRLALVGLFLVIVLCAGGPVRAVAGAVCL